MLLEKVVENKMMSFTQHMHRGAVAQTSFAENWKPPSPQGLPGGVASQWLQTSSHRTCMSREALELELHNLSMGSTRATPLMGGLVVMGGM